MDLFADTWARGLRNPGPRLRTWPSSHTPNNVVRLRSVTPFGACDQPCAGTVGTAAGQGPFAGASLEASIAIA